jgi:hypothetical protein
MIVVLYGLFVYYTNLYQYSILYLFIFLCPCFIIILINSLTICKFYITSIDIENDIYCIHYYSFFSKKIIKKFANELIIEKSARQTKKNRFYLKIQVKNETRSIKQYDEFGWSEIDFDLFIDLKKNFDKQ